jgi:hypothetical protein
MNYHFRPLQNILRLFFVLLISLIFNIPSLGQINVNVPGGGAGPAPGAAFNYRPLGTFWGYDRGQIQLTAPELTAAGVPNGIIISRVAFFLTSFNSPTPNTPVRVLLKEVAGPAGLTPSTYAAASAPATLCFNGTVSSATFLPNTWVTIFLTSPFYFNGGGTHLEVIVETNFGGGGGEAFNGKIFTRSTTAGNYFQYWGADNTPPAGNGFVANTRPDVQLYYNVATPCAGVPGGVTAVPSAPSVCASTPYTISLSGLYPPYNSGYTFQWLSSTVSAAGPFTPIVGATQAIYASPGQIATTWYQCQIRCNMGPIVTSTVAQVSMNLPTGCYCNSNATSSVDTDIGQVVFGAMTNPAAPGTTTNNPTSFNIYTNFTSTVPVQNYTQGLTYPITLRQITSGNFFFAAYFNVFIDYNQDGVFNPVTERVFSGGPTGPTSATPVTTFVTGNITIPFSSLTGVTRMRIVLREGGNNTNLPCGTYTWGETEDYNINIVPGVPCGLTNAGIATTSLPNVCPLQAFTLGINNTVTLGSGMTWQWQSGPAAGGPWTNIAGATTYPFSTTEAATTWYRCQITCGATTLFTTPVQVILNSATQCYCVPVHIPNCNNMWTSNVTFNTLNNSTGCTSNTTLAYNVYPAVGATTTTVTQNQTYNLSVTTSGIISAIISVWIDYNFNGVYEPTEWQQIAINNPPGSTATIPVTIPGTSGTGLTGMRIRSRFVGNINTSTSACLTFGSGETEDYLITINPFTPPACAGTPGPFSTFTSATTACSGTQINLTLNPLAGTVFGGLTYQWQSGPSALGPWTNIVGATNKTYSFNITASEWFRCVVVCTNSGITTNASPVSITVQLATWLGFTDDWNDATNWCGRVPTLLDDSQISLIASGRPAASYYFPVVGIGDTMLSRNITIAATDSITVLTDTTVIMNIAQSINNNGRFAIVSTKSDSITFGTSATTSALIQAFRGGSTPDNIVQVIYTVSEMQAAGMLPNDIIDSIYLRFYTRGSTAAYQNFNISYMQLPGIQDQFVTNDPLPGVTTVYSNPALIIGTPTNGVYTAFSASSGVLKLPATNMRWDGVSNLLLQICYDMTAGTPGGNDFMYLSSTAPRKSCIWLGSTTIGTAGCALTSLSPGLLSNFGQVPSTLRPNIGFRFRRPQNFMNGLVGSDLNNNAGSKFWSSFANLTISGNMNNTSQVYADTSVITLNGLYNNNGSTDFSYTPLLSNRKTILNFNGLDWNNNGLFTAGNSLVNFSGALLQNLGGSNVTTFHELKINKSAAAQTVTMLRDVVVDDTLSLTQGQLRMNLNSITINNGAAVTTGGLLTPVGPITRTNGFIISENANALVNWNNIDATQGYRVVPFGSEAIAAPVYVPFSFQLKGGDIGDVSISTYKAPANLPLPPGVTHLNSTTAAVNNAAATVDRFWMLSKSGPNPLTDLVFRFTPAERVVGMNTVIPASRGSAQPWRQQLQNGAWIRLTTPYTSLTYLQNYGQTPGPSDSVRVINWDWPNLPPQAAQAFPPLFATPGGPIGNSHPWAISINNNPLPVDLLHFDAEAIESDVRIYWSTASEENSDFFTVERTLNFEDHTVIATVPSAGNSSNLLNYETFDKDPADGINYYRLLQTDRDGSVNVISDYIPVRFGKSLKFEILNLLHDPYSILVYNYDSQEALQMLIFDMTGRLLQDRGNITSQSGLNMLELDLSGLSSGIYTIQLRNSIAAQSYRFMKP